MANKKGNSEHQGKAVLIAFILAFILGMVVMYLIAKKVIPLPINICGYY